MNAFITRTAALRILAAATAFGISPISAAPVQASALSDCYDYIMTACDDSITEYGQCIGEGFDLCDNQHPEPLLAGDLDLDFLPPGQRLVVRQILRDRDVPVRVYRTLSRGGDGDGRDQGGRNGGSSGRGGGSSSSAGR